MLRDKNNMANIINKKLSGCYRRFLTFLLVIVAGGLLIGVFVYWQVGGPEGARYWMAKHALGNIEQRLNSAERRPDGIAEEQIVESFQRVRNAIENRQVNLISLYIVMKDYQTEFNVKKPSTPETQEFLRKLEGTILKDAGAEK